MAVVFDWVMIICGGLGLLSVAVLTPMARWDRQKIERLKQQDTSTIQTIQEIQDAVASSLSRGHFSMPTEIYGQVTSEEPVTALFSQEKCLYYRTQIYMLVENPAGITHSPIETKVFSKSEHAKTFSITDQTGTLLIDSPNFDRETIFEKNSRQIKDEFRREITDVAFPRPQDESKCMGFQIREYALLLNEHMYASGEAHDRMGQLVLGPPPEGELDLANLPKEHYLRQINDELNAGVGCVVFILITSAAMFLWGADDLGWFG